MEPATVAATADWLTGQTAAVAVLGMIAWQLWRRLCAVEDAARKQAADFASTVAEQTAAIRRAISELARE